MTETPDGIGALNLKGDPELLRSLLGISELLVVVLDDEGIIRLFNRACEKTTGFTADEVIGKSIWATLIPDDERPMVQQVAARLQAGEADNQFTNHWLTRSGERRLIHWHNAALRGSDGGVNHVVGTGIDITELDKTSRALAGQQEQLRSLLDALPALVAEVGSDYRIRFANRGYREWFDLEPGAQVGRHVAEVIGDGAFAVLQPCFAQALAGEIAFHHGEVPYSRGGTRFIHGTYVPGYMPDGAVDCFYILAIDLTEQIELQNKLEGELKRSRTIVDNAIDGVVTIDEQGIVRDFNPAAERIFGYRSEDIIGRNVSMLMPTEVAANHDEFLRTYIQTGESRIIGKGRELTGRHRDGRILHLQLAVAEFVDEQRHFVGFVHDISQRKQAEREASEHLAELAHVTRISAVGEVTSGLAHELSQPLMAISTLAEAGRMMLERSETDPDAVLPVLAQIAQQGQRASEIIEQLRAFLRKDQSEQFEAQHPERMIRNVLALLKRELETAEVTSRLEIRTRQARCMGIRVQIEQVLFNLAKNAIDAMRSAGGERLLTLGCSPSDDGNHCRFVVADTGPGIPEGGTEKLFHPFYTTKEEGLGQGLSICRSIVQRHGGSISARNLPRGGAEFEFTVPIRSAE
jgi:two-component system, LuxR family, sensor kinase FixL